MFIQKFTFETTRYQSFYVGLKENMFDDLGLFNLLCEHPIRFLNTTEHF